MKEIQLTRGFVALVSDEDYEWLVGLSSWCCVKIGRPGFKYNVASGSINGKTVFMHRVIVGAARGVYVDHKNHNTLDNQRHNLRPCTNSQNQANKPIRPKGRSPYRGVHFDRTTRNCWRACIKVNRKMISLGNYADQVEAAKAYDAGALRHFGEFAQLNFPNHARAV